MKKKLWKDIEGYEGLYQISNYGTIKSVKTNTLLSLTWLDKDGYQRVNLLKNNLRKHFSVHRLVALTFIPNPENKPCVNHKKGIKTDNRAWMLEWVTRSENDIHAYKIGLRKPPPTAFKIGHIPWHKGKKLINV